jgi:uncharacterized protein (DUF983 family)
VTDPVPTGDAGSTPPKGAIDIATNHRRVIVRACAKHCAVCGQGKLFRRWFTMIERCPRCDLRFERIEGHWTGDLGINTIVSFGALLIVLLVGFLAFWPDPPITVIIIAAAIAAGIVPVVFFPFSKTIWLALDLMMRPLEPGEVRPGYGPQREQS